MLVCIDLESKENDHYTSLQAEHEAREMMKSQVLTQTDYIFTLHVHV